MKFLRSDAILKAKEVGVHGDLSSIVKVVLAGAMNNWSNPKPLSLGPFSDMAAQFANSDVALASDSLCMWLEDFMVLGSGSKVVILISIEHSIITSNSSAAKHLRKTFRSIMEANTYKCIQFKCSIYFAMHLNVCLNFMYNCLILGSDTQEETKKMMKKSSGAGITFEANDVHGVSLTFQVFFGNFLDHLKDMMFWQRGYMPSSHLPLLRRMIKDYRDVTSVHACLNVFRDALFGDQMQTSILCNSILHWLSKKCHMYETKKLEESPVDDATLQKHIKIKKNNGNFKTFKERMDRVCHESVESLYGQFSYLLEPILPPTTLSSIADSFKQLIPMQYRVIKTLLGRHNVRGSRNAADGAKLQWEHFTLYVFCAMMHIRDNGNFVWWVICNAASDYGGGGCRLPVFFGLAVAHQTMLRYLNMLNKKEPLTSLQLCLRCHL